jgi:outer membrane cobalamin receptor
MLLLIIAALVSAMAMAAPLPPAVDEADSVAAYVLEEIVVYGPRTLSNTSMVTTIHADEIKQQAAWTIADLLRMDAGLEVTSGPKAETETRIRGFPARDVLVLVDGRPLNPGYYGKVDLSMLPVDNVARVSVVKGPASVAYGPNSMGGIVNIVTQNALDKPRTVVESEFGDYAYRRLSLNHSRQVKQLNYWLSAYEHHSSGYRLSSSFEPTSLEDGGLRSGSAYHRMGTDGKIGFQPSSTALYALSAGYHWAEKDVSPTVYSWDSPTYRTFPQWARFNTSLSANWNLRPTIELKTVVFGDAYQDRLLSYTGPAMREDQLEYNSKLENWTTGLSMDSKIEALRLHWVHTGFSFKRDLVNTKGDTDESWKSHHTATASVFLQDNFRPRESSEVTAGLSLNAFGNEAANGTLIRWCPMVSLRQAIWRDLKVRGGWASAIRYPTLHDLYSMTSGNPQLKPEEAQKFEISAETRFGHNRVGRSVSLEAAFFHNELRNQIYRSTRTERYQNLGSGQLQGWEFRSKLQLFRDIAVEIDYTRMEPSFTSRELMEETAPNRWRFMFSWETRFRTHLRYELGYLSERTTAISSQRLAAYILHNLSFQQRIGKHFVIFGRSANLSDANYEEELGYPAAGRRFTAGLRWES